MNLLHGYFGISFSRLRDLIVLDHGIAGPIFSLFNSYLNFILFL